MKRCTKCKNEYPATLEYFYKQREMKDGLNSWCKKCQRQSSKNYRDQHKKYYADYRKNYNLTPQGEKIKRDYQLKSRFNITLEQYDKMFEEQNGVCIICELPEITTRLVVDHDHKTGKVRGLLCQRCNRLLGQVYENVDTLRNAIKYLQERGAKCQ